MPVYEFWCTACRRTEEHWRLLAARDLPVILSNLRSADGTGAECARLSVEGQWLGEGWVSVNDRIICPQHGDRYDPAVSECSGCARQRSMRPVDLSAWLDGQPVSEPDDEDFPFKAITLTGAVWGPMPMAVYWLSDAAPEASKPAKPWHLTDADRDLLKRMRIGAE